MIYNYNGNLKAYSQELRKSMTKQEKHLWYDFLVRLPVTVKRQKVIGDYIVDFYCESEAANIVIELDGMQHYGEENRAKDRERDEYLISLGITVLRYSNKYFYRNFKNICEDIYRNLQI